MLIENIELTMSHVGLGQLSEYALMLLFGNAHSHALTLDVENSPDQIVDAQGNVLYPAYYLTHLKVPPHRLLSSFGLWDRVDVGVEVNRFGDTLLASNYLLAGDGELPDAVADWVSDDLPFMQGHNLVVVDISEGSSAKKVSVPKAGTMTRLNKLRTPPTALMRSKNLRQKGFSRAEPARLRSSQPLIFPILPGRDVAAGRALVFAKFIEMMDTAEFLFLSGLGEPGLPTALLQHLAVLERETCYFGNAVAGDVLEIHLSGDLQECDAGYHGDSLELISCGLLALHIEVYEQRTKQLLVMAQVKKLVAVPTGAAELAGDFSRWLERL